MTVIITTIVKYYVFPGSYTVFFKLCYSQSSLRCTIKSVCDNNKCCTRTRGGEYLLLLFLYVSDEFVVFLLLLLFRPLLQINCRCEVSAVCWLVLAHVF